MPPTADSGDTAPESAPGAPEKPASRERRAELVALGARVRAARDAASLAQQGLADAVGAHRVEISKIETRDREPGALRLARIAAVLGVSVDALLP